MILGEHCTLFFVNDEHCHLLTTVRDILLPMVSVLDSRSRGLGSRPGCVNVFCSWARHFTLPCSDASLHPGVKMGTDELSGKPDEMQRESTDIFSNQ